MGYVQFHKECDRSEKYDGLRACYGSGGKVLEYRGHDVNHRYLETSVRLPRSFSYLEGKIKEQVQQAVSRGKVEVALTMQSIGSKDTTVEINHDVVMAYLRAVAAENELLRESGLPKNQIVLGTAGSESGGATDALPLSTLLRIPDAFQVQQVAEDADVIWSEVQPVVTEALQQFVTMRQTEGERMWHLIWKIWSP